MARFCRKHPVLAALAGVVGLSIIIVMVVLFMLNLFTRHGQEVAVPQVIGATLEEAKAQLKKASLSYEIIDSVYTDDVPPGCVVEVIPKPGEMVKPGRFLFLTINAWGAKQIPLPNLIDFSERQAVATLESCGFSQILVQYKMGQFDNLVESILDSSGKSVVPGTRLPIDEIITVVVNRYSPTLDIDSLTLSGAEDYSLGAESGEYEEADTTHAEPSTSSAAAVQEEPNEDESWW